MLLLGVMIKMFKAHCIFTILWKNGSIASSGCQRMMTDGKNYDYSRRRDLGGGEIWIVPAAPSTVSSSEPIQFSPFI